MEEMMMMESGGAGSRPPCTAERKGRPPPQEQLNCPRCKSSNTKFCYYNNYSLTQPRYFCKSCRRYWTEGGSLRNVPVGGGSRKNRKSTSVTTAMTTNNVAQPPSSAGLAFQPHDLNLAFPAATTAAGHFETLENHHHHHHHHDRHTVGLGSYIPNLMPYSGRQHEVSDSVSEIKFGMGVEESNINNGGSFAFSFADQSKQHQHQHQQQQQQLFSSSNGADLMNSKGQESSSGYWNGMLGGGGGPW